ncbi:hypothetical protein GCM10010381_65960 [Streptomyces xantholiticus]|nr:hypothetical protein GCM10010381_65960 [Streptomyces xantholiticus]
MRRSEVPGPLIDASKPPPVPGADSLRTGTCRSYRNISTVKARICVDHGVQSIGAHPSRTRSKPTDAVLIDPVNLCGHSTSVCGYG